MGSDEAVVLACQGQNNDDFEAVDAAIEEILSLPGLGRVSFQGDQHRDPSRRCKDSSEVRNLAEICSFHSPLAF